jgi:hypothetical protein
MALYCPRFCPRFQSQGESLSAPVMAPLRPLLMATSPDRPVQDALGLRWGLPDEPVDQTAHFGHGDRKELAS